MDQRLGGDFSGDTLPAGRSRCTATLLETDEEIFCCCADEKMVIRAFQTPGPNIWSKHAILIVFAPSVSYWYINIFSPLKLPVTVRTFLHSSWGLTQNLSRLTGYDWVLFIHVTNLFLLDGLCFFVLCLHQFQFTGIWWIENPTIQLKYTVCYKCCIFTVHY